VGIDHGNLTLREFYRLNLNPGCQRATGNYKSYRNYSESYRKFINKLSTSFRQLWHQFTFTTNSNGNNSTSRIA